MMTVIFKPPTLACEGGSGRIKEDLKDLISHGDSHAWPACIIGLNALQLVYERISDTACAMINPPAVLLNVVSGVQQSIGHRVEQIKEICSRYPDYRGGCVQPDELLDLTDEMLDEAEQLADWFCIMPVPATIRYWQQEHYHHHWN